MVTEETILRRKRKVNGCITPSPIFIIGKPSPHKNVTKPIRM
jgi:hypothetical protein